MGNCFAGNDAFALGTERLVDPLSVSAIHFVQPFACAVPLSLQHKMVAKGSEASPYMGFVVEPYAFFMFYELVDFEAARRVLPTGFRLVKSRVFEGDEEAYYAILSFFRVHTSAFWGARCEFYLVAENERTGLLTWVIVDYMSDTISYDRASGLRGPSASGMVATVTCDARVLVDVSDGGTKRVALAASLAGSRMRALDRRLWVEGNTSIGYGKLLSEDEADVFSLTFPPDMMASSLEVPLEGLELEKMAWHANMVGARPVRLACFPFSQHLLSDSPGKVSSFASESELAETARLVDFEAIRPFSVERVRRGMVASSVGSVALLAVLATAALM